MFAILYFKKSEHKRDFESLLGYNVRCTSSSSVFFYFVLSHDKKCISWLHSKFYSIISLKLYHTITSCHVGMKETLMTGYVIVTVDFARKTYVENVHHHDVMSINNNVLSCVSIPRLNKKNYDDINPFYISDSPSIDHGP